MGIAALHESNAEEIAGYFGPQSMTWRIACEAVLMIGGGRAVLMQLAHPLVAAGVDAFSAYRSDPWRRFQETLMMSEALTFGTRGEANAAARTINRMHYHVRGQLSTSAGAFAAATPYHAHDPDLLFWVLATLIDTALSLYPRLVGPLS
ncbi:MAG TPA: oxygenase MpaB family protein, partial [Ktedonobacterales bacterium]|nr:oxygenase MpaB family protein [Ktedonobacterales bacterium]